MLLQEFGSAATGKQIKLIQVVPLQKTNQTLICATSTFRNLVAKYFKGTYWSKFSKNGISQGHELMSAKYNTMHPRMSYF